MRRALPVALALTLSGCGLQPLYGGGGRLHGALGVNAPRWVMPTRKLLMEQVSWDDALIAAVPPT